MTMILPRRVQHLGRGQRRRRVERQCLDRSGCAAQSVDGVQYKPLFAILCVDLDGKINVNTAGIDGADPADVDYYRPSRRNGVCHWCRGCGRRLRTGRNCLANAAECRGVDRL